MKQIIAELNPALRGWGNYFRKGNADREFNKLDDFVFRRMRRRQSRRGGQRAIRQKAWTGDQLYGIQNLHRDRGLPGSSFSGIAQVKDDPLDSLKVCAATQKLILENQFVRVIDGRIPVGVTEPMHRHPHGVVVYLTTYTNEQTTQDGRKSSQERKAGTASWSEAAVQTVKTIGASPSHAIRIELKF